MWNKQTVKNHTLKFCKERFLLNQIVFYFPKDFYLTEEISHQIIELSANGILDHLVSEYADHAFLNVKPVDVGPLPITFIQISGIFHVCAACLLISFFVFLVELFGHKFRKHHRNIEFIN